MGLSKIFIFLVFYLILKGLHVGGFGKIIFLLFVYKILVINLKKKDKKAQTLKGGSVPIKLQGWTTATKPIQ